MSYEVRPRYTSGSPAMVNPQIAVRVAAQEKDAFTEHIDGSYGERLQKIAREKGLDFIAYTMEEKRLDKVKGWLVHDLIPHLFLVTVY